MDAVHDTLLADIKTYEQQLPLHPPNSSQYKTIKSVIETLKTTLAKQVPQLQDLERTDRPKHRQIYRSNHPSPPNPSHSQQKAAKPKIIKTKITKTKITKNKSKSSYHNHNEAEKSMQELVNNIKETETRFQNLHEKITPSTKTTGLADAAVKEEYEDVG
ncbi:hypothetical protein BDV97DRAFT_368873 [Delphinella strobiligena]|nr:hypothetical protein BDV97DRAFT_368873 [Delphinella strobiligena]